MLCLPSILFSPYNNPVRFSSVHSLSRVWLFVTPWTTARQASLSITNSQSPPKPMSIESVMPSKHLILCHPLLLLPSIFPSIRVFSNESAVHIRWPKYWSFSNILRCQCLFLLSPAWPHPIYLDSWATHSRSLCNTVLYSIGFYFHHQTYSQLSVVSALAQSLHSFWSY